jgi:aminomuconate-semialdehyde/2-hydroxymuconate-6-semialdehyde dehydrogenase
VTRNAPGAARVETRAPRAPQLLSQYIDGRFVPAASGEVLDDVGPATGQVIARLPRGTAADVDAAVKAARRAFRDGWSHTTTAERADLCESIAARLHERAEELAQLESLDTGKPVALARSMDIARAVLNFKFFAGAVRHAATACHEMPGALNYTLRRPLGVVGLITPWNLPLYLLSWKAAPALAMGNTVVAKPSELTPLTAAALAEIIHEVGVPPGVFNLVHGTGAEAGQALVEHPDVAAISFTGGTATGARVAATAAPQFKKLSLELGGKNPTIVFADADFDAALEGAVRAGFQNQGQICLCGSRLLVEATIYEPFVAALLERVRAMRVGDPSDAQTAFGALVSHAHRDKIEGYLELARREGGTVHGGMRPKLSPPLDGGAFLEPAVVTGLSPSCRTAREEIFGPVVTVHPFASEAEAIDIANGVRYGLSASLWTRDLSRAHRVSAGLDTGMVWVNTWLLRDLRVPFGGVKDSGVGREGGTHSLDFFSESRNVCIKVDAPS